MKIYKLSVRILLMLLIVFTLSNTLSSQTAGNFTFSVLTAAPSGSYGTEHLIAIWIENSSPTFVKTKIKYSSNSNLDHLATWTSRSGSDVTDATTGATLASHGTISFLWNGTNVSGSVVPDGTYTVWLEMAWDRSLTTGKTVTSYTFTKGPGSFNSTPADVTNFKSVSLTWTPSSPTSIDDGMQDENIRVFPNPTTGLLNIDFKQSASECLIRVINDAGTPVYSEKLADVPVGIKTFNLSSLSPGAYYIILHMPGKDISFRIIMMK